MTSLPEVAVQAVDLCAAKPGHERIQVIVSGDNLTILHDGVPVMIYRGFKHGAPSDENVIFLRAFASGGDVLFDSTIMVAVAQFMAIIGAIDGNDLVNRPVWDFSWVISHADGDIIGSFLNHVAGKALAVCRD